MAHSPSRFRSRCGIRAALAAAGLLVASPGFAVPITETFFFEGPGGFGVAESQALATDIPVLDLSLVQATGLQRNEDVDRSPFLLGPPATVTIDWNVTNQVGRDLIGDLYLVFARPRPAELDLGNRTETVSYAAPDVGLTLSHGMGGPDWVLIRASDPDVAVDVYYPAVSLGSLMDAATSEAFGVRHVLADPQLFADTRGVYKPGLPEWQVLAAFVPIPEPSTAVLLAGGLAGLASRRRRRS